MNVHTASSHTCLDAVNTFVSFACTVEYTRHDMNYIRVMETLAQRLKWAREAKDMTQGDLAIAAKCSQGTIGNVESGTRVTLRNLARIAHILGVDALWLEDGTGSAHQIQVPALANLNDVARWITIFSALDAAQKAQVMRLTISLSKAPITVLALPAARNKLE